MEPDGAHRAEREQFISDLFHAISQPLTALRCSLEVALRKPPSAGDAREALKQALQATERLFQSVLYIRQLAETERPMEMRHVRLDEVMEELRGEISPVAESMGVELESSATEDCEILATAEMLPQALFLIADFALHDLQSGDGLSLSLVRHAEIALIRLERRAAIHAAEFNIPAGFDVPAPLRGVTLAFRLLAGMGAEPRLLPDGSIQIGFPLVLARQI